MYDKDSMKDFNLSMMQKKTVVVAEKVLEFNV
jgi:hypothetical protein